MTNKKQKGQLSLEVLFFATVAVVLSTGFIFLASSFLQLSVRGLNKSQAFAIAESGIEYYRWHLAHAPQDFQDGTGHAGPYVHPYYDKDGNLIGQFSLVITPPPAGSTIVTIQSTGSVSGDSSVQKIITVKMGIASFARYAWALNDYAAFGSAAEVFGPIHSNSGIHFDGLAHNLVTSALTTSTDPDTGINQWAVYTQKNPADPQPPTAETARADVFTAGRQFPVPAIDFAGMTQNLASIKVAAQASGTYTASSSASGYDIAFATSGIYSLYKVTGLVVASSGCTNALAQSGWGTWSIKTETLISTSTIPQNGNIFVEDNLWVRGQISNIRVTIASGRFPDNVATRSSITVNNALKYTNYTGSDVISLISQNNINVGLKSDDNLRIDGALVAVNGRIGRYYYSSSCNTGFSRTSLTTYGMLGTALRSGFYYSDNTGYLTRQYNYDSNLLYGPPPSFPLTGSQYVQISWDEVQ